MTIEAYGIKLKRLTENDIELVRFWRNSDVVKNHMAFREYITPEMQKKWFRSIDNLNNNYFLIFERDKAIGLISGAQIDWEENVTYNGGIFVWETSYHETTFPAKASVLLTDVSFLMGMKKTYIKVLNDNFKSINFNKLIGYTLLSGQENIYNQEYVLTKNKYFESVKKIRKTIGAEGEIKLIFNSKETEVAKLAINRLENMSATDRSKFNLIIL